MLDTFYGGPPFPVIKRKRKPMLMPEPTEPRREPIRTAPVEPPAPAHAEAGGAAAPDGTERRSEPAATNGNGTGQPGVLGEAGAKPEPSPAGSVADLPDDSEPFTPTAAEPTEKGTGNGLDIQSGDGSGTGGQQQLRRRRRG